MAKVTDDDNSELLLSCRYGDLEDVKQFVNHFGRDAVMQVRDDNGNNVLHMAAGNGHGDILDYLFSVIPLSSLSTQNTAGSTPLHWAALNSHLYIMQKIIQVPGGPGIELIDIKNVAGRSPIAEAEMAGWDEGATWLVKMMKLDPEQEETSESNAGGELGEKNDIQVEIEDADGQIARMAISGAGSQSSPKSSSP